MTWTRLAPGFYQSDDHYIEQDPGEGNWGPRGSWFIRQNGLTMLENILGPFETLREAKLIADAEGLA